MSSLQTSSLGQRGVALASGPNLRDKATDILARQWDPVTNPDGAVNIGTAENHLMIEEVAEFIRSKNIQVTSEVLDYGEGPWGTQRLRNALARFMNRHFHPYAPIDPEHLTFANGCNPIFNMLGLALGDPGDGILLTRPSYIAFASGFGLVANLKPIYVPFHPTSSQFTPTSTTNYSNALQTASTHGIRTRALVLCNPHNPLGRCYPITTLIAILKFCSSHSIHLISDEIYAMSVYPTSPDQGTTPFTSILAVPNLASYIDPDYVHVLYGLSKDFCAGGMRVGCLYTTNGALRRAVAAVSGFHWPGGIDQVVAATVLEDEEWVDGFSERSRRRLGVARGFAKGLLGEAGIAWEEGDGDGGGVNAGFFLWVDLRRWVVRDGGDDDDGWEGERVLVERMKAEKVFLTAGRAQGSSEPGWFRFVFSREETVVREGIRRLVKCLEGIKADMDKKKGV